MRRTQLITLLAVTLCMNCISCTRHVSISKEMTWECAPQEYKSGYHARPDEYVRFRFVEDPHCFEVESKKDLCAELRQIGKPVITARFDVWGGRFLAKQGFRMEAIEDRPLVDVGGWGSSGANDPIDRCPIDKTIEKLR